MLRPSNQPVNMIAPACQRIYPVPMIKKPAIYLMNPARFADVFGADEQIELARQLHIFGDVTNSVQHQIQNAYAKQIEVVLGSWGMPVMDAAFFETFPNIRIVLYAAGAVNRFMTEEVWSRDVIVCTANIANGLSVAEYTVAQLFMCLKRVHQYAAQVKAQRQFAQTIPVAGSFGSILGLVSLGAIGRMVVERLRASDLEIIAYDPFVSKDDADQLGVRMCSLDELFSISDVVSCHTPWLPETVGMLTGRHFSLMKPNASFINTARGAVVRELELITVLSQRPDLVAILDVTWPEPPANDSLLYTLPNVILTPHIAGSMGAECRRMSRIMIEELNRYLSGQPLKHRVTRAYARALA